MEPIKVCNLKKQFGDLAVLKGVSFSVAAGETVAVIGPSGSGKSTMLRCLINLEKADDGDISIFGRTLCAGGRYQSEKNSRQVCADMGMVFQSFNLFPHMTVAENLMLAPVSAHLMTRAQAKEQAMERLTQVGLADKFDAMPQALSGGQKQRVAIARALMMSPQILLFDEPTSSLDPQLTAEVLAVMRSLATQNMTMVVVTHEMGFAREAADRILFMTDGEIAAQGTPQQIFGAPDDPRIREFISSIL